MNWLIILTQNDGGRTGQIRRLTHFRAGTTRNDIFEWAVRESGMPRGSVVAFFYAEPDEVTA